MPICIYKKYRTFPMNLLYGVPTLCSVFSVLSILRATTDTSSDHSLDNIGPWTFCEFQELPEESRQEDPSCAICMASLEEPGTYGYTKIAVCYRSAKHMFHASCLFRNTFKTENVSCCPICRYPFVPTNFYDSFLKVIQKAAGSNEIIGESDFASALVVDCNSDIYKYVLKQGILLRISGFDYSCLFIHERVLLLSILRHIKHNGKKTKDQREAYEMTQEFAKDMISDIMSYEFCRKALSDIIYITGESTLIGLNISLNQASIDANSSLVLESISNMDKVTDNLNFILFSNLLYSVIYSELTLEEKSHRLLELISTYYKHRRLNVNQRYALLHLFAYSFPGYKSLMKKLAKKKIVLF